LGPVQNADQLKVVEDLAASVEAQGGTIVAGGNKIAGNGYFFEPTIVTGLTNGSRLVDEEPFGPILPIIKFSTIEEAVRLANDSENGLGGSVWSNDIDKASKIAMQLECGTSWVNEHGAIQPDAPFGGVKQSGFGVEFGTQGLKEFTHIQTLKVMK
jgi:acyl-CoA reductase-like NAD-dependent aldehyde dehydrogenase